MTGDGAEAVYCRFRFVFPLTFNYAIICGGSRRATARLIAEALENYETKRADSENGR